jgi:hypothetical protein
MNLRAGGLMYFIGCGRIDGVPRRSGRFFRLSGLYLAGSGPLRFQNRVVPLVRLPGKTVETKKRGSCGDKVKTENNAHYQERKQRFLKKSHRELALFDPPPTLAVPVGYWISFSVVLQAASLGALRARRTRNIRQLARSIRDVEFADLRESAASTLCRYGFGETW